MVRMVVLWMSSLIFALAVTFLHGPLALWPSVALLAALALARRFAPRVRYELKGLGANGWLVLTMLAPAVAALFLEWSSGTSGVGLGVGLFTLVLLAPVVHAQLICAEFAEKTSPTWLAQPRSLAALVFEKWAVGAGLTGFALAQLAAVCTWTGPEPMLGPALAAVIGGFSVLCSLVFKDTLTAAFVTLLACLLPAALVSLVAPTETGELLDARTALALTGLYPLVSAACLGAVLRRPRAALLVQVREPTALAFSAGRGSARRALLLKELRLQLPALGLMVGVVLLWLLGTNEAREPLTLFGGLMVTTLAGISGVLSEKAHGTFYPELTVLPVSQAFWTKCLIAAGVASVGGLALPLGLLTLSDGAQRLVADGPGWALVVTGTLCLALASSVYFKALTSAFAGVLIGGMTLLTSFVLLTFTGMRLVDSFAARQDLGPRLHQVAELPPVSLPPVLGAHPALSQGLHAALQTLPILAACLLLLAFARRTFVSGELPRRKVGIAAIALSSGSLLLGALDYVRLLVS